MKNEKKISLNTNELEENASSISEFLSKKGLASITGGQNYVNYSESTSYTKKALDKPVMKENIDDAPAIIIE